MSASENKPIHADTQVRQLAELRQYLVSERTSVINNIRGVINKHNMAQNAPTQCCETKSFQQWVAMVQLPAVDRLEIDLNIQTWELYDKQILETEAELVKRSATKAADVCRLETTN